MSSSSKASKLETQEELTFQDESKAWKRPVSQLKRSDSRSSLLHCLFVLISTSMDWMRSTHIREDNLLSSGNKLKC